MPAGRYNFVIEKGASFTAPFTFKNKAGAIINLTGYTARLKIKKNKNSTTTLMELTTENGRIAITGASGLVTLTISATDTAAINWVSGFYDLELVTGSTVKRYLQGQVIVSGEVTNA